MSGGATCGCASKWQPRKQRETHRHLLGLFLPCCSRLLLLRVCKDQVWALGLQTRILCCLCCQMFRWRFFSRSISPLWGPLCQGLLGFLFPFTHLSLQPGITLNFACALLSLCLQEQWQSSAWGWAKSWAQERALKRKWQQKVVKEKACAWGAKLHLWLRNMSSSN